jgi:antirestriction protein ArdC
MASSTVHAKQDHYQQVTNAILASLEQGTKPWSKPWQTKDGAQMLDFALPHNVASGHNYRGMNVPMLWAGASAFSYTSHQWLSFEQAKALGGYVRKGEKSTLVYFFKRVEVKDRNEGADADATRSLFLMRASPVFNVAQCEGVRIPKRAARVIPDSKGALGVVGPIVDALHLDAGLQFGGDQAYYASGPDLVQMPHAEAFSSRDAFHAVLLHECGHATGHTSRLKREFGDRFGSDGYAFEELVAELTSAFTQSVLGIRADLERHASYIDSWSQIMRKDKHAFTKACTLAQAASDYLLKVYAASEQDEEEIAIAA